jgi:Bacterial SH3 domain
MKTQHRLFLCLCFIFSLTTRLSAQFSASDATYYIHSFGDNVNMRSEPGMKATVVRKLRIGERITPLELTKDSVTVNGISAPWVKVKAEDATTGYVWQGMLSIYAGPVDLFDLGEGLLMMGLAKENDAGEFEFRFVQNGVMKKSWVQDVSGHGFFLWNPDMMVEDCYLTSLSESGFNPPMNLIGFYERSCVYLCQGNTHYYSWDGRELRDAFYVRNEMDYDGETESSHSETELSLPGEAGKNTARIVIKEGHSSREGNEEDHSADRESTSVTTIIYSWVGGQMKQISETRLEGNE